MKLPALRSILQCIVLLLLMILVLKMSGLLRTSPSDVPTATERFHDVSSDNAPDLYEYYGKDVKTGISTSKRSFTLNGKAIRILSGSLHYFRVHPNLWKDRIRKLRAAGLNTIDTYVPWNLHEPKKDQFDFGTGNDPMSDFLNLAKFIDLVKEEKMFLILRPGPYICAEWEFGGLPSWLLRDPTMKVRSSHPYFLQRAVKYLVKVAALVTQYQFSEKFGVQPIIMVAVENEYGHLKHSDTPYLEAIKNTLLNNGLQMAMLFTADSVARTGEYGVTPGVFQAATGKHRWKAEFDALAVKQPEEPYFLAEYWPGWFDHWGEPFHHVDSVEFTINMVRDILEHEGASINLYMFHGGTNFGFFNGANLLNFGKVYKPTTTSYDYNAPLDENGEYTPKYWALKQLLQQYNKNPEIFVPEPPMSKDTAEFPAVLMNEVLELKYLLEQSKYIASEDVLGNYMESLEWNSGNGQSYGFTYYQLTSRVELESNSRIEFTGRVNDIAYVLVNGNMITKKPNCEDDFSQTPGYWAVEHPTFYPGGLQAQASDIGILVENTGRNNYGYNHQDFEQQKGLGNGSVLLDDQRLTGWNIYPMEFKKDWLDSLKGWRKRLEGQRFSGPVLLKGTFIITTPRDTYLDMNVPGEGSWEKGVVFVNGFNLGRYWRIGPQQCLYIPRPLLREGKNEIVIFELYSPSVRIHFSKKAKFTKLQTESSSSYTWLYLLVALPLLLIVIFNMRFSNKRLTHLVSAGGIFALTKRMFRL